ncbi:MAG: hypothetical protein ABSF38_07630 [Verrucomicrobiota bacterium]|jgi:hypothetical protein
MNAPTCEPCRRKTSAGVYVLGVAGTFLVMAWLVWLMRSYTQPPALAAVRAAERLKIKADFLAANAPLLESYAWQDPTHDVVRIPVARAKELILQEWQNPVAGHSLLTNRAAKAFAPVAEAKNQYE